MASTQSGSRGRSYPVRPSVSRAGACGGLDTPPALPLYGEAARLAELVDAAGLGPAAARCGGSSPSPGTNPSRLEAKVALLCRTAQADTASRSTEQGPLRSAFTVALPITSNMICSVAVPNVQPELTPVDNRFCAISFAPGEPGYSVDEARPFDACGVAEVGRQCERDLARARLCLRHPVVAL